MGLLDRVKGIRQEYAEAYEADLAKERKEFYEIAVRDYLDKPKDDDADRLYRVMETLESSDEEYQNTVRGVGRVMEATASVEHYTEAMDGHSERYRDAQRNMHQAQGELKRAHRMVNELSRIGTAKRECESRLRDTMKEFPNLFDDDGNPHPALNTLIKKRKAEMKKQAADREKAADEKITAEVQSTIKRLGLVD